MVMYSFRKGNIGCAIAFVSLSVSVLTLPIYLRAEEIQDKEAEKQKRIAPRVKHIRRNFNEYKALEQLPRNTVFTDSGRCEFVMFSNQLTHESAYLQLPEYAMSTSVDNDPYDFETFRKLNGTEMNLEADGEYGVQSYFVNMASVILLVKWFDYLKDMTILG